MASTNSTTAKTSAFEYSARTKFLRLLAISTRHFNLNWHVQGAFMRHLLSGSDGDKIKDTPLTIFLTPAFSPNRSDIFVVMKNKTQSIVGELEVMGIIDAGDKTAMEPILAQGPLCVEPAHIMYSFTASMFITVDNVMDKVKFPLIIKAFPSTMAMADSRLYPFETDNIMLGANSIHVVNINRDDEGVGVGAGAKVNSFGGIDLIEKMVGMQHTKNIPQAARYTATPWLIGAAKNAALLMRSKELVEEGYSIQGGEEHVAIENVCDGGFCPICYEPEGHFTSFQCGHMFCVDCISKHMVSGNMYSAPACPMCRSHIIPRVTA
jgi:hypothetical protein